MKLPQCIGWLRQAAGCLTIFVNEAILFLFKTEVRLLAGTPFMSKDCFSIKLISKKEAKTVLEKYHYLTNISRGFKSGYNYGLFTGEKDELCGVVIFTSLPVPELTKGCFGLDRKEQDGFFELSRLCLTPEVQQKEHNLAGWFSSKAIKELCRATKVRAILSYADNDFHSGIVYAATNWKYYGLTTPKKDFWFKREDGSYIKHNRGKVKNMEGEWRERSRKHRFLKVFDPNLKVQWKEEKWIKKEKDV